MLWSTAHKKLSSSTASGSGSRRLDSCPIFDIARSERESDVDSAHLLPTIIQLAVLVILTFHHTTTAYTTKHAKQNVLWRCTSGEAAGVRHTGSCSRRPTHRWLSLYGRFVRKRSSTVFDLISAQCASCFQNYRKSRGQNLIVISAHLKKL